MKTTYTSRDLLRAYREKNKYGSVTRNAKLMGISATALKSLINSLDRASTKGMHVRTRKAWDKIHAKRIAQVSARVGQVELPAIKHTTLTDAFIALENTVAQFIDMAVEKRTEAIVQSAQAENDLRAKRIQELEEQVKQLQIIADVARQENRFVAITKKFFHGK